MIQPRTFFSHLLNPSTSRPTWGRLSVTSPDLFPEDRPLGNQLNGHWRQEVAYRLAELGHALRPEVPIYGLPQDVKLPGIRAVYQGGVLFLDRRAVRGNRFKDDFLASDLLQAAISSPFSHTQSTEKPVEDRLFESELCADLLTVKALANNASLSHWFDDTDASRILDKMSEYDGRDQDLLTLLVTGYPETRNPRIFLPYVIRHALERIGMHRQALAVSAIGKDEYADQRPTYPVNPDTLRRFGLPGGAIQTIADRYGWVKYGGKWDGGFLPLQTLGIAEGLCCRDTHLYHSGILAGPTSAGKTLLAEIRMQARRFTSTEERQKTVMLVPTREIGIERWHGFREAYANRENRQRPGSMKICYSDGEHHGDDYSIREGRFDVAIMVNEKFRYFAQSSRFLQQVGEVVFDELNVMTDADRGIYLELALTAALRAGDHTSVMGLTTPATGLDSALRAMQASGRSTFHIETTRRPIPIEAGIWCPQTKTVSAINCNSLKTRKEFVKLGYPGDIQKTLKELLVRHLKQTPDEAAKGLRNNIVFAVPTKKDNITLAHILMTLYIDDEVVREIIDANANTELIATRLAGLEPTKRREMLLGLLPLGIGFHDADLTAEERKLVGQCFRASEIPVLVCTSTMAQGINLPAQTIVFVGWGNRPPSGREGPERDCYYHTLAPEFVTWLGRVGRYGKRIHRQAQALYLAQHGPGSEEYETIERLLATQRSRFETMLEKSPHWDEPVLFAINTLRRAIGKPATFDDLLAFFESTPSAARYIKETDQEDRRYRYESRIYHSLVRLGNLQLHPALLRMDELADTGFTDGKPGKGWANDLVEVGGQLIDMLPRTDAGEKARIRLSLAIDSALHLHLGYGGSLYPLCQIVDSPSFRSWFLRTDDALEPTNPPILEVVMPPPASAAPVVEQAADDKKGLIGKPVTELSFQLTRLGRIASGYGVSIHTCRAFYMWLLENGKEPKGWDVLDVFTMLRRTPNGADIQMFRTRSHKFNDVRQHFADHLDAARGRLGEEWADRSPLVASKVTGAHTMATLLAMRDWRVGAPIYSEADGGIGGDIETRYGLFPWGCSVYEKSREFARLLRVFAAVANGMPEGTFPASRPIDLPRLEAGVVCLPYDLDEMADEMLFGIPRDSASLAKIGIEGLTRAWVMQLKQAVDERGFAPDLPLLERIRILSEDEAAFRAALPTPGLAERILVELKERTKVAMAENLRKNWKLIETFYSQPFIAQQHVEQGKGRYTAFKMRNQRVYTVMRRNASSDQPIGIDNAAGLQSWIKQGAVEVLAEIGRPADKGESGDYVVDSLFCDMDPKNDYPLDRLKRLAMEVYRRFSAHEWVDRENVRIHWTGGKGFHIIAFFKGGVFRPVEQVKRVVEGILSQLCNDVDIYVKDQTTLPDPFVILDLSPLMLRGLYRNAYSLNAATGNVCIPVDPARLNDFDPVTEAIPEAVLASLGVDVSAIPDAPRKTEDSPLVTEGARTDPASETPARPVGENNDEAAVSSNVDSPLVHSRL